MWNKITKMLIIVILALCIFHVNVVLGSNAITISTNWDPSTSTGADYCGGVSPYGTNIYEPLVFVDYDMNLQPGLAESWERVDDYTWRFHLREGVKFHDGTTFDADAAVVNFDKWVEDPIFSTVLASRLYLTSPDQIRAVDDYTLEIKTTEPLGCLPGRLSNPGLVMVSPEMEEYGKPDGTGPFKFVEMIPMQSLQLAKNEEYWGDLPKIEVLIINTITDPSTKVMALESGDFDLIYGVQLSEVSSLESNFQVFKKMVPRTTILRLNCNRYPLSDPVVRRAINYAIDRDQIVDYIYEGMGAPAKSFISPVISWSAEDELNGYPYNSAKSQELLAEDGWKDHDGDGYLDKNGDNLKINLVVATRGMGLPTYYTALSEAIQEQLEDVGIEVELVIVESGMYWPTLFSENFDMLMDYFAPWDGDASHLISDHCHSKGGFHQGVNLTNQALVDQLIEVALTTSDANLAKENYREVQRIVMDEEAICVPLVYEYEVVVAKDNVKGFQIHPITAWGITMNEVYFEG